MAYILHSEVYSDLEEIDSYIGQFSPAAADRLLDELFEAFDMIARFPHHGHSRPDVAPGKLRFKVVRGYLIAYLPDRKPPWITAVIDGRQHPRTIAAVLRERE